MVMGVEGQRSGLEPQQHLILAGGGHSHALVLRMWAMQPRRRPNALVTLVSRGSTALYSGMVPGVVAGLYDSEQAAIDIRQLCQFAGVCFVKAEITGLDLTGQRLLLACRAPVRFDWLSLDVGAELAMPTTGEQPNLHEPLSIPVKPLEPFLAWCQQPPTQPQLLGSGAAAVELALALRARGLAPTLRTKASGLALGSPAANRLLQRVLNAAGIACSHEIMHEPAQTLNCTGSRGPSWLAASGLPTNARGRVHTDACLMVEGQPNLFASGDCAVISSDERPASGVWAVRAAPVLVANLKRAVAGHPLRRWRPQRRALQLLGDGGVSGSPRAIALWGPLALGPSHLLWRWKDRIDRNFMQRFSDLADHMQAQTSSAAASARTSMACRGCAAKLAAEPLRAALQALPELSKQGQDNPSQASQDRGNQADQPGHDRLLRDSLASNSFVNDDAAVIDRDSSGNWLLQSVDGFPALLSDPWLNARLTTLHACSDLWACGAGVRSAQVVVTLPQLPVMLQSELLLQTMAGVRSVLDPLGAPLLGGHTLEARDSESTAAERLASTMPLPGLSLMLTVNGSAPGGRLWAKGPLQAGDALILTRPIGSGVLFAAAMAGASKTGWIDDALAVMLQSQAALVALFAAHGCRACTDITGFGLLGHLGEMLTKSSENTHVNLDAQALIRLALPGSLELLASGYASTLAPSNAGALALLEGEKSPVNLVHTPDPSQQNVSIPTLMHLLIDPQTCGPLLAALPAQHADDAIKAMHAKGFQQAAVVGLVV
ncbi:MAG: selenide, water dikinase SelD [Cyanobacteriota bacterium]|nr:selenide, water dikinase SelD [Cyanobacteriota bacterium]